MLLIQKATANTIKKGTNFKIEEQIKKEFQFLYIRQASRPIRNCRSVGRKIDVGKITKIKMTNVRQNSNSSHFWFLPWYIPKIIYESEETLDTGNVQVFRVEWRTDSRNNKPLASNKNPSWECLADGFLWKAVIFRGAVWVTKVSQDKVTSFLSDGIDSKGIQVYRRLAISKISDILSWYWTK